MTTPQRNGAHPLDDALADSTLLQWLTPTFQLLGQRVLQIAPFAAAATLLVWALPHISLAGPFDDSWRGTFDEGVRHVLMTAVMMAGYAHLARSEGRPWGVGALVTPRDALLRLAVVAAIWAAVSWVLGWLLGKLFSSPWMIEIMLRLFFQFDVNAVYLLLMVMAAPLFMLATAGAMAHIGALRGNEPIPDLFVQSFRVVFGQPWRFLKSSLVIMGTLITVMHLAYKTMGESIVQLVLREPVTVALTLVFVMVMISLPWWFVTERALRPELGVEDDVEPLAFDDTAESDGGESVAASDVADTPAAAGLAAVASTEPAATVQTVPERVAALVESDGAAAATAALVDELRTGRLDRDGFLLGLASLPSDAPVPAELAALALTWQQAGRDDDLAWLVRLGLKRDKGFLMEQPETALAVAQQLIAAEQPQLASHLLLAFVNRQRSHAGHRDAGLRLARLLAFRLDNVEGARRLVDTLALAYPDDTDLTRLRAQLP